MKHDLPTFRSKADLQKILCPLAVLLIGFQYVNSSAAAETPSDWAKSSNKDIIFELRPDPKSKSMATDVKGHRDVKSSKVEIVDDEKFGTCLHFGEGGGAGITIKSSDKDSFAGGVTFEAWLFLEKPLPKPARKKVDDVGLIWKKDSFTFKFDEGKLYNAGFIFHKEKIATDDPEQFDYWPMLGHNGTASTTVPTGKWVHIAFTYDEKNKLFRYWIDGEIDSERQLNVVESETLPSSSADFKLFSDLQNAKVAGARLIKGPYNPGPVPPAMVLINQLPWQDKVVVTLDRIDDHLSFPLQADVLLKTAGGQTKQVAKAELTSNDVKHLEFNMNEGDRNKTNTCIVKLRSRSAEVFSREFEMTLTKPSGQWAINPDKSLSVNGKKIFPLLVYNPLADDYPELKKMGFNMVIPRRFDTPWRHTILKDDKDPQKVADSEKIVKAAAENGLYLIPDFRVDKRAPYEHMQGVDILKNSPNLFGWYVSDEPWGPRLQELFYDYNTLKLKDPDHLAFICQNNMDRGRETSTGCDILGPDPYPIPRVCLRLVSSMVESAIRGSYGLKPVWAVLDAYPQKLPNKEEMRCMVYLALCSGANGIAIFDWDERMPKDMSNANSPKYLKNHPKSYAAVKDSIGELAALESIIVNPNVEGVVDFEPKLKCMHAAVKAANGKKYLLLASDSRQVEHPTIVIKGINSATAKPLPECGFTESIHFTGGKGQVNMPKIGAAIFELNEN